MIPSSELELTQECPRKSTMMNTYARGRTSGRGRGGRNSSYGRGRGRVAGRSGNSTKTQEREVKFSPINYQGKTTVATYATTKDAVVQHIRKTYRGGIDIGQSIEDGVILDLNTRMPVRSISTRTDATEKVVDQSGLDIRFQEELRRHLERKDTLEQGMDKAYALIFSTYCTKVMQGRIENHPDFDTIKNDPIAVLEAIKSLMHDSVRAQNPVVSMTETLKRLVNARQQENESLLDYVKRFKQLRDVVKSMMGSTILDAFTQNRTDYQAADPAEQAVLKAQAISEWMAYLLMSGSDQNKYGTLMRGLVEQFSLGNNQYPKTILTATDVLSNHKIDAKYDEVQKRKRERSRSDNDATTKNDDGIATSFAQSQGDTTICYCCGKVGHLSSDCDKKNTTPRNQWHVNRALQGLQNTGHTNDGTGDNNDANRVTDDESTQSMRTNSSVDRRSVGSTTARPEGQQLVRWSGLQFQQENYEKQEPQSDDAFAHLKDVIILDTGSTLKATFMNDEMVTNIRKSDTPIKMTTNAGNAMIGLEAIVPGHGQTWFDPDQIANVYGFSHMVDEHRITYDSEKEDAFLVHTKEGVIKFARTPDGLYAYRPSNKFKEQVAESKRLVSHEASYMVTSVEENRSGYTQRQFENAKRARRLYHVVGCPTVVNFKHILRQNIIKNCPVTAEDVNIAEKIFGGDIGALKGKTTRRRPTPVREDLVEIPPELLQQHQDITYCMDIMYVNGMPMMTGIDRSIRFRSLVPLNSRVAEEMYRALDVILRAFNKRGYNIKTIHCDGEFRTLMNEVNDNLDIEMNYTSRGEHVPEAERNNRTIGERIRGTYHNLPYKAMPRIMLRYLAMVSTNQLNLFPAKGGVSAYLSPSMILTGKNLDFEKHCQVPFGAYVQANQENDPTNTQAPRTIDAIYLRPMTNIQGGHELMNLHTGQMISRSRIWERPITNLVIQAVEALAHEQGITTLKLTGRNKINLFPADWIAGVEYEDNNENAEDLNDDTDHQLDAELEDDGVYDRIDQAEIEDLLTEISEHEMQIQDVNPINRDEEQRDDEEHNDNEQEVEEHEDEIIQPDNPITDDEDDDTVQTASSRPSRERHAPERLGFNQFAERHAVCNSDNDEWRTIEERHNLVLTQAHPNPKQDRVYKPQEGMVIARVISDINSKATINGASFAQQYIVQRGLKKFGQRGSDAATKEMDQLHRRNCFTPIDVADLTIDERRKTVDALMFLGEKRDKTVKGRMVYNGKPTREWLSREESTSPTAALESILLTAIVDAKEGRDVMTADIPNAFIQTKLPNVEKRNERVIMKITGVLVDLLVNIAPEVYGPYVVTDKHRRVLYVQVLRGLYGMLVAALMWYTDFKKDLEGKDYKFNPYDPCVANKLIRGKRHTVRFHVDDIMASHMDPTVNDDFEDWLNHLYGSHGKVTTVRGNRHDYLGMTFDFSIKGKVVIDMIDYMKAMVDDFPVKFKSSATAPSPAAEDLFAEGEGNDLNPQNSEVYHTFVAKGLFACKRARPDIHPTIAVLSTRVKKPNEDDWRKLHRLLKYINGTREDKLILSADDLHVIKWYVDCAFAVHPDFKSHTGGNMTYGQGTPMSMSRKQKLNTRSSTEAELVGPDDMSTLILWTRLFMQAQGYEIEKNILYQDNKSTILLEQNGKKSSSKRTRALNIRYFFLTDQIEKGNLSVEYCPTTEMVADYFSKPLQGKLFQKFRKSIMGH